jgi:hypothetical protein
VTRCLLLAILLGAGCDVVFGLERPVVIDAGRDTPLPDAPSNCLPTEHDEDGDLTPDRCDLCPQIAEAGGDADTDGVGDLCDPQPEEKNRRLAFFPFDSVSGEIALFTEGSGSWTLDQDRLVITGAANGDYIARFNAAERSVIIETRVTLTFTGRPTNGSRSVGVWTEIDLASPRPAFPVGFVFELVDVSTMQFTHLVETFQAPNEERTPSSPDQFESGRSYVLRLTCGTSNPRCYATSAGAQVMTLTHESGEARDGAVGLRVHGDVSAAFDYMFVLTDRTDGAATP